jgi:hypothetical protein
MSWADRGETGRVTGASLPRARCVRERMYYARYSVSVR